MKIKLLCICFLILCSCQNTTRISGQIFDENGSSLEEVKVQIIGTDIYTFTNQNGYFEIDPLDRGNELLILKKGYKMIFYDINSGKKDLKFYLKPKIVN